MEPLNETVGVGSTDSVLPDIQPRPYMTQARKDALAKARGVRDARLAARKMNTQKTKRVLIGLKTMFESLRKKSDGPQPDKNPMKPKPLGFQAPVAKPLQVRERVPLIGGPKLKF